MFTLLCCVAKKNTSTHFNPILQEVATRKSLSTSQTRHSSPPPGLYDPLHGWLALKRKMNLDRVAITRTPFLSHLTHKHTARVECCIRSILFVCVCVFLVRGVHTDPPN